MVGVCGLELECCWFALGGGEGGGMSVHCSGSGCTGVLSGCFLGALWMYWDVLWDGVCSAGVPT